MAAPYAALRSANLAAATDANAVGMRYYRAARPQARRTAATAIVHSGGKQTIYGCVCGSRHTVATLWRDKTVHLQLWRAAHADCIQAWIPLGLA